MHGALDLVLGRLAPVRRPPATAGETRLARDCGVYLGPMSPSVATWRSSSAEKRGSAGSADPTK